MIDEHGAIRYVIKKYFLRSGLTMDEMFQIGYIGYLKALNNYDPSYGSMSRKYIQIFVKNEILRELTNHYRHINYKEYDESIAVEDSSEDVEQNVMDILRKSLLYSNVHKLNDRYRYIIYHHYLSDDPKQLMDIAEEWGVSKQRVSQLKDEAVSELRDMMGAKNDA